MTGRNWDREGGHGGIWECVYSLMWALWVFWVHCRSPVRRSCICYASNIFLWSILVPSWATASYSYPTCYYVTHTTLREAWPAHPLYMRPPTRVRHFYPLEISREMIHRFSGSTGLIHSLRRGVMKRIGTESRCKRCQVLQNGSCDNVARWLRHSRGLVRLQQLPMIDVFLWYVVWILGGLIRKQF
jgi:hypothetical protein